MDIKSRGIVVIGCVFVVTIFSFRACAGDRAPDVAKTLGIGAVIGSLSTSIDFYGKLLDQDDRPIEGAVVTIHVRHFSPIPPFFMGTKYLSSKTGQDGIFEVHPGRGLDLFITEFSKEGYEFRSDMNPEHSFQYGGSGGEVVFVPDRDNPVIFRMRKKLQERTFLFSNRDWGLGINRDGSGEDRAYDFVEQKRTRPADRPPNNRWSEHCDLRYRATFDEEAGEWEVVFSSCGIGGGIFASPDELFEAPEGEYRAEWSFMAKDLDLPGDHFLYVKSRSPSVYSRVELTDIRATKEHVRIYGNTTTNPYGDRVLDAVDIPLESTHRYRFEKRLKSEAQAALREGRLPERPKMMALIEAAIRGEE